MTVKPIINIRKGGPSVSDAVIDAAKEAHMAAQGWPAFMRDDAMNEVTLQAKGIIADTPRYDAALRDFLGFEVQLEVTYRWNTFNRDLEAYRKAKARVDRYRLADGRPEAFEDMPTGEYGDEGQPVMESVLVQTAIEPLPAMVEVQQYDDETGEPAGTVEEENPAIVQDDVERAAAQAVIDGTPQGVRDWA